MIKTILVRLTGEPSDKSTLETAYLLARLFDARLECLRISPDWRMTAAKAAMHDISGPIVSESFFASFEEETKSSTWRARLHLAEFCRRWQLAGPDKSPHAGGVTVSWREISGHPGTTLIQEGRFHDLIVVGHGEDDDIYGSLILGAGRPILLAPHRAPENLAPTIAIAWKETPEAARAITAAMPLLAKADRVLVMSVEDGLGSAATMASAQRLAEQLRWHSLNSEAHYLISGDNPVAGAIFKCARDNRADLIVSGAYGHSRLREIVLGGLTRDLLRESNLPVFLFQ